MSDMCHLLMEIETLKTHVAVEASCAMKNGWNLIHLALCNVRKKF